jgi:ribosomal protein S18 acetylase RimI-like enzyme
LNHSPANLILFECDFERFYEEKRLTLSYRPALPDEYEDLFDLMLEQSDDYIDQALTALSLSRDKFFEAFRSTGSVRAIVGNRDILGFCWTEQQDATLHIHALILKPRYQGLGIGPRVMADLETSLPPGVNVLEAGVHESNSRALRLCRKCGFEAVTYRDEVGFHILRRHIPTKDTSSG